MEQPCVRESQSTANHQIPVTWVLITCLLSLINTPINSTHALWHSSSSLRFTIWSILHSLHTYLCFAYLLDSPAILQMIIQDSRVSNDSPALILALLSTRTPLSCEREGYQFLHRAPAYIHPHDTHHLITLLLHCISLNKRSCVILTCCLLALSVTPCLIPYVILNLWDVPCDSAIELAFQQKILNYCQNSIY